MKTSKPKTKKNLKKFNRKIVEKKAIEKVGPIQEVSWDWASFRQDLESLIVNNKESLKVPTAQLWAMAEDYQRLNEIHERLQRGCVIMAQRNNPTIQTITKYVIEHFNDSYKMVLSWYYAPNPMLGGVSPIDMCIAGREDKLLKFVESQREQHKED